MTTKEFCQAKYLEFKAEFGRIPLRVEFLKYAAIDKRKLEQIWGRDSYSRLQTECGDETNKLSVDRAPMAQIMLQYGQLALEIGDLPTGADWSQKGCRPTVSGLRAEPHSIAWSTMPNRFADWVATEKIEGFDAVLALVQPTASSGNSVKSNVDLKFEKLVESIRAWTPARRRASEGEYKVELRGHLQSLGYKLNEEYGESNIDLLVDKTTAIELKKDPSLGEFDRLFGQLARHRQQYERVVALILDSPKGDHFDNFSGLVDKHFNPTILTVEVIKK